jgi:cell division protein FtsQ
VSPSSRPGMPVPRGGPSRPAPPRPPRPRPDGPGRPASDRPASDSPASDRPASGSPADARPAAGSASTDAVRAELPSASATSDAVTTYTAGRRALGLPVRPVVVSGASAARFAERVAMRRRIARHKAYVAGAVVALLGALAWLLLLSPVLALDVTGVQVTGAGTVVDVADVQAVVDEVDGTPLPRLDTIGLRDRVLEVPGVREAKVSRIWPHGLVVALVSREPVAAVPEEDAGTPGPGTDPRDQPRGGFTLLDTEGFEVGWTAEAPEGLPVVSVPVGEASKRTLTAVLTILQALPPELRTEVSSIEAATRDTVRMGLRDGKSVVWGSAGDAALKIRVLQALRAAPAAASAQEYDVSAPTLPITR